MERNAIPAGYGSLINRSEIKILICYILGCVRVPVHGKELANVFNFEEIANYFEVVEAIEELADDNTIIRLEEDLFQTTPESADAAETLKSSLPITIKEKAYSATMKMIARRKNAEETDIKITKENGNTYITCSALENGKAVISVKMMVADDSQAYFVKKTFLEDPSFIYTKIVDLMIGSTKREDDTTQ